MATAKKMWSRSALSENATGQLVYTEAYHVVDADTKDIARTTTGVPRRNDPYATGSKYLARNISVASYNGPTQWLVLVEYAIPDAGQFPTNPDDSPLLRPMRWTVQASYIERASEMDATRRIKKNSAGDLFPPTPQKYRRRLLVGTRYERFWDIAKSRKYENKTNLNQIMLGPVVIPPGEALCHAIEPAAEFEGDADYLLMQYVIELAVDERATPPARPDDPPISGYPFDQHQLDIGNFGWFNDANGRPQIGRFCRATGTTAANVGNVVLADVDDVQLNGQGKPVANTTGSVQVYVRSMDGAKIYEPITNPVSSEWLTGGSYGTGQTPTASPYSTANNPTWLFRNHVAIDWQDIFTLTTSPTT